MTDLTILDRADLGMTTLSSKYAHYRRALYSCGALLKTELKMIQAMPHEGIEQYVILSANF